MSTIRWRGDAPSVAMVDTYAVGGTWAAADTITFTLNGKSLVLTLGATSAASVAAVVAAMVAAWNGAAVTADETRSVLGTAITEFKDATASGTTTPFTLTAATAGVPFGPVTITKSSVSGTIGSVTHATANSGPNDVGLAANYSGGALPINGDTLDIENTTSSLLYHLDALSGVTLAALYVNASFTGQIGLPKVNAKGYYEYRPDYLEVGATSVYVGRGGSGTGSGRLKIATGAVQTTLYLDGTGNTVETGVPALLWTGTHASNALYATKGSLGLAFFAGETATLATMDVGFQTNRNGDVTIQAGTGLSWTTLNQTGGSVTLASGGTTVSQTGGTLVEREGNLTTANVKDDRGSQPTFVYNGAGTIGTLNAAGKVTIDLSQSQRACIISAANLYGPVKWVDPYGNSRTTLSAGLVLQQTGLGMDDGPSINRGRNYTLTFS